MRSAAPTRKVTAATLGAAVAALVLWAIPGKEDPATVAAVTTVAVFIAGWIVPEAV